MAGHSKWANIQHRKGAQDVKRGKIFTKLIREITVAARMEGGDPASNPRLRAAIDKAFAANMPKDKVERAIQRGTGDMEGISYEEIRYEGYGPCGVAIMVDCMTDNRNRTVGEVRHVFSKRGGNLGTEGSVAYLFEKKGIVSYLAGCDENKIMDIAIEVGAEDVVINEDGSIDVFTQPEKWEIVKNELEMAGLKPEQAEIIQYASTTVNLELEDAEKMMALIEALEDLDDVQQVHSNANFPQEVLTSA
ncbi:YebC/PmpR family DNA-binding transcriptional regulator [Candidatus Nitrosacidococcus sp. I8]|uniref:YebC/PmpR family DNA-binding transcriptional regulator n=1 Tax=Candidatus Nitrosacidococcus sp. I8 TaxID=2942908 RepID=UPI002227C036|nr:YebC/PmpR family DNA-binding transcriptional regulator [Candidatus Nitrosacidococcus sp. I8]CAH9019779.1 putative transcriptional regulatory protein [Candidatus Nitrosacidococcus sp. I8]